MIVPSSRASSSGGSSDEEAAEADGEGPVSEFTANRDGPVGGAFAGDGDSAYGDEDGDDRSRGSRGSQCWGRPAKYGSDGGRKEAKRVR